MASRPGSQGDDGVGREVSTADSGVRTITAMSQTSDAYLAQEVASEVTSRMVDRALYSRGMPVIDEGELLASNAQLREELARVQVRAEDLERLNDDAGKMIDELSKKLSEKVAELQDTKKLLHETMKASEAEVTATREAPSTAMAEENAVLRERIAELERVLTERSQDGPSLQPTFELPPESTEEQPLLTAAYQQISVLNTQLAHLYTELTMARTEAQHLRGAFSGSQASASRSAEGAAEGDGDQQKQSQQIADLVGDIRHLQLDLEYHQQKLDQLLEEKQKLLKELKRSRAELGETKQTLEEREQLLRHREVDLQQLRQKLEGSGGAGAEAEAATSGIVAALRTEAAAKDSALIVSHYELHKEKLLRDRLEQKNMKLMERMQKLMMVVETMRKENVSLEKIVQQKDRAHDEKDAQLRQATQKAKQLQRLNRSVRSQAKPGAAGRSAELDGLPPLTQRSTEFDV